MRTFVIPDVHGHWDRLIALLRRAEVLVSTQPMDRAELRPDVEVIQLGDLGHYGSDTGRKDYETWKIATVLGIKILMGNHDQAVYQGGGFRGYTPPFPETRELMPKRMTIAMARDGFLLTHAGLHPDWVTNERTVDQWSDYLNSQPINAPILDDIAYYRSGISPHGGILWRDARERLYRGFPQVFGHTRSILVRKYGDSWCLDTGDIDNGSLVGMWLDTKELVAVGPDAEAYEDGMYVEEGA